MKASDLEESGDLAWSMPDWKAREVWGVRTFAAFVVQGNSLILVELSYKSNWTQCSTVRNGVSYTQRYEGIVYGEDAIVEVAKRFEGRITGKPMGVRA